MPDTPTTAPELADRPKQEYTRPQLRELGPLADLTQTLGGAPGATDGATGYVTS